jgi:hypothetical protein
LFLHARLAFRLVGPSWELFCFLESHFEMSGAAVTRVDQTNS